MPEISRFLGIVVGMFYREHGPPHFHATYAGFTITVEIESGIVTGRFPRRALLHVMEWRGLHRVELFANWDRARDGQPLIPVEPLE